MLYSHTEFGLLVALLMMVLISEKRERAIEIIYEFLRKSYENNPSSLATFCLSLTNKLVESKLFEIYVDALAQSLVNNKPINDLNEVFNGIDIPLNREDYIKYMKLRKESFDELNPAMKSYLMHKKKSELERKMYGVSIDIKEFEKMSFELRNDYQIVVAEGHCEICQFYFRLKLSLQEYLNVVTDQIFGTCPVCKKDSIAIPLFDI